MILFAGSEERGFFVRETAKMKQMQVMYLGSSTSIEEHLNRILEQSPEYLVIDVEQYVDDAAELAQKIESVQRAKNCEVVIYVPGYDCDSRMVRELAQRGMKYFLFSGSQSGAKEELERCMAGYYLDFTDLPDEKEAVNKEARDLKGRRIGVTGVCRRMGTTTAAIQIVKYLQLKGYKACYIEVNDTGFVLEHGRKFVSVHDEYFGRVTYENVDMYYKQENLNEILKLDYDYFVFDYGAYSEQGFNKTSFLEKDVRIFVAGSKASELGFTQDVIKNEYYTDVKYLFNFISEKEKADLMEYMEEKSEETYFTVYAPDQFEYIHNPEMDRLLPVEDRNPEQPKRNGLFRWKRKKDKAGGAA